MSRITSTTISVRRLLFTSSSKSEIWKKMSKLITRLITPLTTKQQDGMVHGTMPELATMVVTAHMGMMHLTYHR